MMTKAMWNAHVLRAVAVLLAVTVSACGLEKQDAPALSGPSEFGESISVSATPDRLSQDGVSQVTVVATIRDQNGKPKPGVTVKWTVVASTGVLVEPSAQQSVSDGNGAARMFVTAPPAPAFVPSTTSKLTITATPVNGDALSTLNKRIVEVQLVPPAGTLLPNRAPIASFTVTPVVGNIMQTISFDATQTTDEGEPCNDLCTYAWDFGDYEAGSGRMTTHSYSRPANYTVTLTVTDPRGGVGSTTKTLNISGPSAPVAAFTVSPASPKAGSSAVFNAGTTTVGLGATISSYAWEFGDGAKMTTEVPGATHTYGAAGTYFVLLTVTDSFGRTASATGVVTVIP